MKQKKIFNQIILALTMNSLIFSSFSTLADDDFYPVSFSKKETNIEPEIKNTEDVISSATVGSTNKLENLRLLDTNTNSEIKTDSAVKANSEIKRKAAFSAPVFNSDKNPIIQSSTKDTAITQQFQPIVLKNKNKVTNIDKQPSKVIDNEVKFNGTTQAEIKREGGITMKMVVDRVFQWHPLISRSVEEVNKTKEAIDGAKAAYFPTLKAGVQSNFENDSISQDGQVNHNFYVSVNQNIYDFGKTSSDVDLAEANYESQIYYKDQTLNKLIYDSIMAYVESVRYKNLVSIAGEQVKGFKIISGLAKTRSSAGASADSDYTQALVRVASAEALLYDYTAQYKRWSSILDSLTNSKMSSNLPLAFDNYVDNGCMAINKEQINSPDTKLAEAQIRVAKAQLDKADSEQYPTISVAPTYQYRLDNNYNKYNKNKDRGEFGVLFNVSVPITDGGGMTARKNEAQYSLSAAQHNLDYQRNQVMERINESASQISSIRSGIQANKNKVASAIRTRNIYRDQYADLGIRAFSDLINSEAEIHQTNIDIINSEYNIQRLSIECLYNAGKLEEHFMGNR